MLKYCTFHFKFKFLLETIKEAVSHEWTMQKVKEVFCGTLSSTSCIKREDSTIAAAFVWVTERQHSAFVLHHKMEDYKLYLHLLSLWIYIYMYMYHSVWNSTFQLPRRLPGQSPVEPAPPSYTRSLTPRLYWLWREHPHGSPRAEETLITLRFIQNDSMTYRIS